MVVTRSLFAQFAHVVDDNQDANVPAASGAPISARWNRVTPTSSPAKKRKSSLESSSPRTPKKSSPKKKKIPKPSTPTVSFSALTAYNFTATKEQDIIPPVHTLLLGTHPSVTSLEESRYYGHPMKYVFSRQTLRSKTDYCSSAEFHSHPTLPLPALPSFLGLHLLFRIHLADDDSAFWWIAGDCLGFRRAKGLKTNGDPYGFTSHLIHDESKIIPYEQQIQKLCSSGFALWDIVKECERPGSLDSDITKEVPNDIRGFCQLHPTIKRIVFSNGGTSCSFFKKHFKEWLDSGELVPSPHKSSQDAFKKWTRTKPKNTKRRQPQIELVVAIAVSPAAARYTYEEKRDFWEEHVYKPGLEDFEAAQAPTA
ncbi:MAG: hypothetical protein SGBAC_009130 [Bacillariaceae sp.]